jgi:hypothetical protein
MNWNRDVICLAKEGCTSCGGHGFHTCDKTWVCECVLRAIFRICYARFKHCTRSYSTGSSAVRLEPVSHAINSPRIYGRKNEEYLADFTLIAKRTLTNPHEYQIFKFHFLLGADWKLCCVRLKIERGEFFHALYRIQQKLGRAFRETQPYSIFPLDEYFGGSVQSGSKARANKLPRRGSSPVRPPLAPSLPLAA